MIRPFPTTLPMLGRFSATSTLGLENASLESLTHIEESTDISPTTQSPLGITIKNDC